MANKYLKDSVPYIFLSILSAIVFSNSLNNTFVYDDSVTVVNNNLIKNWKNFHTLFSFNYFVLSGELSYRPIVTLTYFIDHFLWGLNPMGFHLTNLILHIGNTLLFYVFLKRVTKTTIVAFFSIVLFTTHPILTETINSISYREDLIAALFFLVAFILFMKADQKYSTVATASTPDAGQKINFCTSSLTQEHTTLRFFLYYTGSLCSYLLALFSKEMAITLPIMMVLFTVFYSSSGNPLRAILKRARGIYIGYFFITCFYLFLQFVVFRHVSVRFDQTKHSLIVMLKVFASYVKLFFFPFNLNADYVVPPVTTGVVSLVISALLISAVIVIVFRLCKNNKQCGFFALWFFVTLLPVSNIIPIGNSMAERYLYIPIMGFSGIIGILVQKFNSKKSLATILFTIVILILSVTCIYRNGIWHDEFSLWYSTLNREPGSARAHHNIGVVYSAKGFYDYAEFEYKNTLKINPGDTDAHYNLGNAYERKGMFDEAVKEYQEAIQYNPYYADGYNKLGNVFKRQQLLEKSVEHYKKAIQCNPFNPYYYNNLGLVYNETKLYSQAIGEFTKALKINPKIPSTHNFMGNTYKEMGNFNEALIEYKAAIEADSTGAESHNNLGIIYMNTNSLQKAVQEFETAIRLDPKLANVHNNLGIAHAKKGDYNKAILELNNAVAMGFDNADVHNNLAGVYLTNRLTDNAITELKLALKYEPRDINAHCNLGNAYISKSFWDEAIAEFKEVVNYSPANADAYYDLGNAFCGKGRYKEAEDAFIEAVHYKPNNPQAHKMLGVIYANYLNSPSKAIFHLNETLRLDPGQTMAKEITEAIKKLAIKTSTN